MNSVMEELIYVLLSVGADYQILRTQGNILPFEIVSEFSIKFWRVLKTQHTLTYITHNIKTKETWNQHSKNKIQQAITFLVLRTGSIERI